MTATNNPQTVVRWVYGLNNTKSIYLFSGQISLHLMTSSFRIERDLRQFSEAAAGKATLDARD